MRVLILIILFSLNYSIIFSQQNRGDSKIPFALTFPNKAYYKNSNGDSIFSETYINKQKTICLYLPFNGEFWATYYPSGIIKEFGEFKVFGRKHKKNLTILKIGLWNYYNESGNLEKVIDYGKGKLGAIP